MAPSQWESWLIDGQRRPLVMGILNVTPDSFSDGGRFPTTDSACRAAQEMLEAGADWLDIGGESTRPGSQPVPADEQIRRTIPLIRAIRKLPVILSIDTTDAHVAAAALDAGADVVNDISAGRADPMMLPLVARRSVTVILMHMQGTPATMQVNPSYRDVTGEVMQFLADRRLAAVDAGVERHRVLLDPGLGFGKTVAHNLSLLRDTARLASLASPLVVGPSRKGFVGQITGEARPADRLAGTMAAVAFAVANGAAVVRVHDVKPIAQTVRMIQSILANSSTGPAEESGAAGHGSAAVRAV